jgi:hypothetical protein
MVGRYETALGFYQWGEKQMGGYPACVIEMIEVFTVLLNDWE